MTEASSWLNLAGKVCVVTGAGQGIGRAIAEGFLRHGAKVVFLDRERRTLDAIADQHAGRAESVLVQVADVTDHGSIEAVCEETMRRWGACDVLVNNASILVSGALADIDPADWMRTLAINLNGYLTTAQVFGAQMRRAKSGALVHISSIAGLFPQENSGAYSPAKAAVAMLSRQLACEWGPDGVRSNTISPGLIETPLTEAMYATPGVRERREQRIPVRRIGTPEDIANCALFLASEASAYLTGQDIVVDGGFSQTLMGTVPRPGFD